MLVEIRKYLDTQQDKYFIVKKLTCVANALEKNNSCAFFTFLTTKEGASDFSINIDHVVFFSTKEEATKRLQRITVKAKNKEAYEVLDVDQIATKIIYTVDVTSKHHPVIGWVVPKCFGKWVKNQRYDIENVKNLLEAQRKAELEVLNKEVERLSGLDFSEITTKEAKIG